MSHSYYLYETGEQKLERLKRQRMDRIRKQLREAGDYIHKQGREIDIAVSDIPWGTFAPAISDNAVNIDEVQMDERIEETHSKDFVSDGNIRNRLDLSGYMDAEGDMVNFDEMLMDYRALCILLGKDEEDIPQEQLRSRLEEMMNEYAGKSEKEIVADTVNDAMRKLGMRIDGCCILDSQHEGELYSLNDNKCKVFVSCNDSGIMIEPINASENVDDNTILEAQKEVCKAERRLIDEVEKSGIILKKVYSDEHKPEMIARQSDLILMGKTMEANDNGDGQRRDYNRMRRNRRTEGKTGEMI